MPVPMVFLPGLLCDPRVFAPQLQEFGRDHPVTVAPVTMGERIEEIASNVLDGVPGKFALVGYSLGGMVAMEILRRAPDRVMRVAFVSTLSLAETPQSAAEYEPLVVKLKSGRLKEAVEGLMPAEHLAPGPGRAQVAAQVLEMAEALGPEVIIRQVRAVQRRRDYQAVLRQCKLPALVLCGAADGLTPVKRHQSMSEMLPYARFEEIPEAGHFPTLESPAAVNRALRAWLGQKARLPERA